MSHRVPLALLLALLCPAAVASAQGVLEINQACAEQSGCFPGDAAGFPVTITQPGSYRLTSNLVNLTVSAPHVSIEASKVTLDLGGFDIRGPVSCIGTPPGCSGGGGGQGIRADGRQHVVVRNGTVSGVGSGSPILLGERATVEDVHVDDNFGSAIVVGSFGTVQRSTVVSSVGHGISAGDVSRVVGNVVMSVGSSAILCGEGCVVIGNSASGATNNAFFLGKGSVAQRNTATNSDVGFVAGGGSLLQDNTVRGNQTGILVGQGSRVVGNAIRENSGSALSCSVGFGEQPASIYSDNVLTSNNGTTDAADGNQGIASCITQGSNWCGTNFSCP